MSANCPMCNIHELFETWSKYVKYFFGDSVLLVCKTAERDGRVGLVAY